MGTWKLAYADFLTALAAFFLLMWLLSDTSPAARVEIAAYFRGDPPATATPFASAVTLTPTPTKQAEKLFAALTLDETLSTSGDSLVLTQTPDGVRLELIDRDDAPLFDSGSNAFTPNGEALIAAVAHALQPFDVALAIEGHTDAFSGAANPAFSNWDLSAARAAEARRLLTQAGLAPGAVQSITGLADTRPLTPGQPHLAANRRISLDIRLPTVSGAARAPQS